MNTCDSCKWFYEFMNECHRHAPFIVPFSNSDGYKKVFPYVMSGQWCGDHEPKEENK